jgi:hypothetical protein
MMANYAKIVNGYVQNVIVADSDWIATQIEDTYVLSTDENFACVGGLLIDGRFVPPQPFPSWSLDEKLVWQAPIELPADGKLYSWDEAKKRWVKVPAI